MLNLEGAQAGLSWITVLQKRNNYRQAFDQFDANKIAEYGDQKIQALLNNKGIIRNKLKIHAFINNARAFLNIKEQFGSFDRYIWQFVDGTPIISHYTTTKEIPANNRISDMMSKDLKQRGFKFTGSTICYAYMQSVGMVNDHLKDCFRWTELTHPKQL
jgi:DNA-3-methyladenine glycosylase I